MVNKGSPPAKSVPAPPREPKKKVFAYSAVSTPSGGVTTNGTAVYGDVVATQRNMVATYLFLPLWMAVLVPMVIRAMAKANESPGGDTDVIFLNITASLGSICFVLCALSAYGTGTHRVGVMTQVMVYQAIVAPGLVFCGAMLYGSEPTLATGAVIGGLGNLVCAYFLRLQLKNEMGLQEVCQEDLITAWAHPSAAMHSAAVLLQSNFRMRWAAVRMTRAREFDVWLNTCSHQRSVMKIIVSSIIFLTIACLTYTNLVFAARFDRATCTDWLTTCVVALLVEIALQQPVILLMTGVLGDFVEEGADFILEIVL